MSRHDLLAAWRQYRHLVIFAWTVVGILAAIAYFAADTPGLTPTFFDAYSYWGFDFDQLYAGTQSADGLGPFRYAPVVAQVLAPLSLLPFAAFLVVWEVLLVAAWLFLTGRLALAWLAFFPLTLELAFGNIHLLLAAAVVLGFRWPATWAFVLLTKVTPGIGLLWFAVRREWRNLGIAIGATVGIVTLSAALFGVHLWIDWAYSLARTPASHAANQIAIPLLVRIAAAAVLTIIAGLRNQRWLVLVAACISLPTLWIHGLSMLVGIGYLARHPRAASALDVTAAAAEGDSNTNREDA